MRGGGVRGLARGLEAREVSSLVIYHSINHHAPMMGFSYFLLHWFLLSKTFESFCKMQIMTVLSAKILPKVSLYNSVSPVVFPQLCHLFYR